jgi:cyanate permease
MMTVKFSSGQIVGPVLIGFINDLTHNLSSGLWASAGLLLLAVICGLAQRDLVQAQ